MNKSNKKAQIKLNNIKKEMNKSNKKTQFKLNKKNKEMKKHFEYIFEESKIFFHLF
jgi:hypothetical protein